MPTSTHRLDRPSITTLLLVALLVAAISAPTAAHAQGPPPTDPAATTRTAGATAVDVAVDISGRLHADGAARHVALARDDQFADALAAAPLTAEGPLLFTPSSALDDATAGEIARVLPAGGTVYLLGGPAAISQDVEDGLRRNGFEVRRLAGASRVQTSLAVADELGALYPHARGIVALARADAPGGNPTAAWADAVTGGAWAATRGIPVVLTPSDALHADVAAWMTPETTQISVLLGGEAALSPAVEAAVPRRTERIAGSDRAGTAASLARLQYGAVGAVPRHFVLIDGYRPDGWAHGLAAAGLGVRLEVPLLLVGGGGADGIPVATRELVSECGPAAVELHLVGDESVISPATADRLEALDGAACSPESAYADRLEVEIREQFSDAIDLTPACDPPEALRRGAEVPCRLDVHDDGVYDDFALVLVTADDGSTYRYEYGTGIFRSGADIVRAVGPGLSCQEQIDQDLHYFLVALYFFEQGEPSHMDPDRDGMPCEDVFPADELTAFWS